MAKSTVTWNGPAVTKRLKEAQRTGINQIMALCVQGAKTSHTWQTRTGVLEGGIDVIEYAQPIDAGVQGTWGVFDVVYALIHELGGTIKAKTAKALKIPVPDGTFRFVQSVTIPARPYLRPQADLHYPNLAERIRIAYEAGGARG